MKAYMIKLLAVCIVFLSACSTTPTHQNAPENTPSAHNTSSHLTIPPDQALLSDIHQVSIITQDQTRLAATVYQPALAPGEKAPLIIHTHGFALSRMSRPLSLYGTLFHAGKTALSAWREGYWVISLDQRGHGGSQGAIGLSSPEHEVKDISDVIDWAIREIPRIQSKDGDPLVGMLGESYGGSVQVLASMQDERIDAIVPITAWHDLSAALLPNHVPKSGWLTFLIMAVNSANPTHVPAELNEGYFEARSNAVDPQFLEMLKERSPRKYCREGRLPQADALIMQSFRDTLFTFNQALEMQRCFEQANRDVRLIGTQEGHLLPFTQFAGLKTIYAFEDKVSCGTLQIDTQQVILDWFDEKLKNKNTAGYIPKNCLSLDEHFGVQLNQIPVGGKTFHFNPVRIKSGFAGFFEWPMKPVDTFLKWTNPFKRKGFEPKGGFMRPAFIPVTPIENDTYIVGVPTARLELYATNPKREPTIFVGVGVKRKQDHQFRLISDQVTPIHGHGHHEIALNGISARLKKGDMLGLVISSYNNQYRFSGSGWLTQSSVSGEIKLPLRNREKLLLASGE